MSTYIWKGSVNSKEISAEIAAEEIAKTDGTPQSIVDAARSPESPLHGFFEWDDSAAAEAHRKHQARLLTASITVAPEDPAREEAHRAFESVTITRDDGSRERKYVTTREVRSSSEMQQEVGHYILVQIRGLAERLHGYDDFKDTAAQILSAAAVRIEG